LQSRPFGVALLVAGCDEDGPVLYHTDPSGTYVAYEARAIGSGSEGAQSLLQEKYSADMSLKDAEALAMSVLKQVRARRRISAACVAYLVASGRWVCNPARTAAGNRVCSAAPFARRLAARHDDGDGRGCR